jgi:hypothetical protein
METDRPRQSEERTMHTNRHLAGKLLRAGLLACTLGALALTAAAQEPSEKLTLDRKDLDASLNNVLHAVINAGADLYNPPYNDHAAC